MDGLLGVGEVQSNCNQNHRVLADPRHLLGRRGWVLDIGERKKLQFAHEADESAEEQLDRRSFVGPQTA